MAESSPRTDAPLRRALDLAGAAVARTPAGLLTDFDGTLSPIVHDPAAARLVDGASGALAHLVDRLAVVAVITGREPLDARRMTGVPGLLVAGNHGVEWLEPNAPRPVASPRARQAAERVPQVLARLPPHPGVSVEDKGISATIHYRAADDPDDARDRIRAALGEVGPELELRPGRMSLELRPVGLGDKGVAAAAVIDRFDLQGVVVMGDDLTDLDMFRAVAERRAAGTVAATIIGVGGADREVPSAVADAADVVLADPAEAAALLVALGETV